MPRDDRILPETRAIAAALVPILLITSVILYGWPGHTDQLFYLWSVLYALTPPLVPLLWWRRVGLAIAALGVVVAAALIFVHPQFAIGHWPWDLTPLTARVMAAWMALPGVAGFAIALDSRWSSWRVPLEGTFVWAASIAIAMLRARDDLIHARTLTPVAVAFVPLWLVSLVALYAYMTWLDWSASTSA